MSRTESRKGKSAYFVPTISISLVLIVVGMLVFILLNARDDFGSRETKYWFCRDREG